MILRKIIKNYHFTQKIFYSFFSQQQKIDTKKNYYKILGVNRKCSQDQIKLAYYKLAKEVHPDAPNGNQEKFREVNQAYNVLSDQQCRNRYDFLRYVKENNSSQENFKSFQQFKNKYDSLNQQLKQEFNERISIMRKNFICLLVIILYMIFLTFFSKQNPHKFYMKSKNNKLIPIRKKGFRQQQDTNCIPGFRFLYQNNR